MKRSPSILLVVLMASTLGLQACATEKGITEKTMEPFLIDNFSSSQSALGTTWEGFTDRVMGGVSDMRIGIGSEDGRRHLYMAGEVSLKNNGGFIQARLLLRDGTRKSFDASAYTGIRLVVKARGDGYYIFLRTAKNIFPWSFFMAPIEAGEGWQELRIPFSAFTKGDFGSFFQLDLKDLSSIAVSAYKKEFAADLKLREIGFY